MLRDEIWTRSFKEILRKLKKFIHMHGHKNILHTITFMVVTNQNHQIISPESPTSLKAKEHFSMSFITVFDYCTKGIYQTQGFRSLY